MSTGPSNADIMRRLADMETAILGLQTEQAAQGKRLSAVENERAWLKAVVMRMADSLEEVRHRTQVILQRAERAEEDFRALDRKLDARPCLMNGACAVGVPSGSATED